MQPVWDWWWIKWHCNRLFSGHCSFPMSASFHRCSILILQSYNVDIKTWQLTTLLNKALKEYWSTYCIFKSHTSIHWALFQTFSLKESSTVCRYFAFGIGWKGNRWNSGKTEEFLKNTALRNHKSNRVRTRIRLMEDQMRCVLRLRTDIRSGKADIFTNSTHLAYPLHTSPRLTSVSPNGKASIYLDSTQEGS